MTVPQAMISIHASHAGCDVSCGKWQIRSEFQSTHPMRDATSTCITILWHVKIFQSTHPMRDATYLSPSARPNAPDFNPRIPCGMRQARFSFRLRLPYFNPRIPCGMRLRPCGHYFTRYKISIHASHAGCDKGDKRVVKETGISIHASHAGCDWDACDQWIEPAISIHASHAGCDVMRRGLTMDYFISIHASHAGCDVNQ